MFNKCDTFLFLSVWSSYRLLSLWTEEVNQKSINKASFESVWMKFIRTRSFLSLVIISIMALSSFLLNVSSILNVYNNPYCVLIYFKMLYLIIKLSKHWDSGRCSTFSFWQQWFTLTCYISFYLHYLFMSF